MSGIGGAGRDQKLWILSDLDNNVDVVGQFTPTNLTKNVRAVIGEASSVNRDLPIHQFVRGAAQTVSFDARLWASDDLDLSVEDRLTTLENLVRRDSRLKRPPICALTLGSLATLQIECLVESIGGVIYDEVRTDGRLRGVSLRISLRRYEEVTLKATDPSVPETFTRIRRSRRGDTYDSVALREYGDPELGVLLRQLNPRLPGMTLSELRSRDPVHVYPEEYLLTLPIEPEFHAFKTGSGNEAAEEARREMFELRSGDVYATIFGDTADGEFV